MIWCRSIVFHVFAWLLSHERTKAYENSIVARDGWTHFLNGWMNVFLDCVNCRTTFVKSPIPPPFPMTLNDHAAFLLLLGEFTPVAVASPSSAEIKIDSGFLCERHVISVAPFNLDSARFCWPWCFPLLWPLLRVLNGSWRETHGEKDQREWGREKGGGVGGCRESLQFIICSRLALRLPEGMNSLL